MPSLPIFAFDLLAIPDLSYGLYFRHRRRFKVRIRSHLDAGACVLEVKTRGGGRRR